MKYSYALAALAAAIVEASPFPQGVTMAISPTAPAPSGCSSSYSGTFGIAIMNVTAAASGSAPVTQSSDGQPGAATTPAPLSQISDGQPQASTAGTTVAPVSQISDGQPQATTGVASVPAVTQISDGQIQATTMTMTMQPMNQIGDGQIQNKVSTATVAPVTQISDGQIQATTAPAVSQISDGQIQATTAPAVSQISDGQIQATTAPAVSQISDGQIQASTAGAVSQISDGQIQASTSAVGVMSDGQPTATAGSKAAVTTMMVSCKNDDTLAITLADGVLTDAQGRTGYIASNYQFQFDGPPQAGAIYTSGFTTCGNGSLALGGSNVFYQCLSGDFYNLYDRNWAPQCSPVTVNVVNLVDC